MRRRQFLGLWAACGCCLAVPHPVRAAAEVARDPYYQQNRERFFQDFTGTNTAAFAYLAAKYDPGMARDIAEDAFAAFRELLPDMPAVGGDANWCTAFVVVSGWYLAYYRAMRPHGLRAEDAGRMIYDLNVADLARDAERYAAMGEAFFAPWSREKMADWAAWTMRREYPDNWVARFVEGDGEDFDFGYDYTECGAVKYMTRCGAPEMAPYLCVTDFPRSRAEDTGLARTGTLAMGADRCDFRYKKGRAVTRDWDTEIGEIRRRYP